VSIYVTDHHWWALLARTTFLVVRGITDEETSMKPVTVINCLRIKPGKMDEFIDVQRRFAASLPDCGLIGGRMYRSIDGESAVLVSVFQSKSAREEIAQRPAFKEHLQTLQAFVESSSPSLYEEAYTTGDFE
jgi:quinol monooxygenase YgiN